jgi:hypothetical protein
LIRAFAAAAPALRRDCGEGCGRDANNDHDGNLAEVSVAASIMSAWRGYFSGAKQ